MAKFLITAVDARAETVVPLLYDNMDSSLTDLEGRSVVRTVDASLRAPTVDAPVTSREAPLGKTSPPHSQNILGLVLQLRLRILLAALCCQKCGDQSR